MDTLNAVVIEDTYANIVLGSGAILKLNSNMAALFTSLPYIEGLTANLFAPGANMDFLFSGAVATVVSNVLYPWNFQVVQADYTTIFNTLGTVDWSLIVCTECGS